MQKEEEKKRERGTIEDDLLIRDQFFFSSY